MFGKTLLVWSVEMPRQHRGNVQPQLDQDEHDHVGHDDDLGPGYRRVKEATVTLRVDETSTPNVTYLGEARVGTGEGEARWKIQKIDETTNVTITFADGDEKYDNIWTDRTSITYS